MDEAETTSLVSASVAGDHAAFERIVARHERELLAHCYRMLGSRQDAEDAVQETLVSAWRGLSGFQGRSSLRTWLYRIATNSCLRQIERRPRRQLSPDHGPARTDTGDLGERVGGPVWLEPWPDDEPADIEGGTDPAARYLRRESVELAFVAALQFLPGTQRAVLVLRDVLAFPTSEVAQLLDTTTASVNSALQRARQGVGHRVPARSQQAELAGLGPVGRRELVDSLVTAWENADVATLVSLLADDARFTMPPLPAWFDGKEDVARFLTERVFATRWHLVPLEANAQLGVACYILQPGADTFVLSAISVIDLRAGKIARLTAFLDPETHHHFELPAEIDPENHPGDR